MQHTNLTPELLEFVSRWQNQPGNLIMILHRVQKHYGYLPKDVIHELAQLLHITEAKIYGVATFYHFFKLEKPGRHIISICTGTACYLKGAGEIIDELQRTLQIGLGQVTQDEKFSMEEVRCLGCCGLAPVIAIDGQVFGRVNPKQIKGILEKFD